ncbi:MAG: CHAT domain-containing protein [Bacteroidetes bacterium]|nr:MAG: CHAT domain-containing protein [Bacteroidota bacterium]
MEDKLQYFHFFIGNKEVRLRVAGPDGAVLEEATSPLNFEDNLFSALNVLYRLMNSGGRSSYQPDRAFIRKIGSIQASLLNMTGPQDADPVAVQTVFEKHWKTRMADADARACFTFDFSPQPPYTELAELPWEFLSYQDLDLAVQQHPATDFIRQIPVPAAPKPLQAIGKSQPLQVLLIISEPDPEALRRTDKRLVAYRESYVYRLLRIYENMTRDFSDQLQLRVLFQPRPAEVQQAQLHRKAVPFEAFLEWFQKNMVEPDSDPIRNRSNQDFTPHVVHFMGHVSVDEREEEVVGCINNENDLAYTAYSAFAACFGAAPPPLLILQTPEGVQLHKGPFTNSGLLADLAQKRLPYILSFQHPVREQGSLAFLSELYRRLFDAQSIPAAVTGARMLLSRDLGTFADVKAFGSPTLYTTFPVSGPLHYRLVSALRDERVPEAAEAPDEKLSLAEKIRWYEKEIRRLVEYSELDLALNKFREIINIAIRSEDADAALAESYRDYASNLLMRYHDTRKAYNEGHIDNPERARLYRSIGATLLDYFKPGELPRVATKAPREKPVASTPRLR